MKSFTRAFFLLMAFVACANLAQAHFVWVEVVDANGGKQLVRVAFSEAGEAGAAYLVDRIAESQATAFFATKDSQALQLEPSLCDETGWLTTELANSTNRVQLQCKYGVFSRGESAGLLQYYASFERKTIQPSADAEQTNDADNLLALQVRPHVSPDELPLQVLWHGKPLAGSETVMISPDGSGATTSSNKDGEVLVKDPQPGTYRIRVNHDVDQAGTHDGESYSQEMHYSTLTLQLVDAEAAKTPETFTAAQLLAHARAGRAVWNNFPGFTADITVYESGTQHQGAIEVNADGSMELQGLKLGEDSRVEQTLRSMIAHRMGSGAADDDVSYADDDADHPLGRLINLEYDTSMGSSYRVQGDVIREVNRSMGGGHFTITVLDVYRNPEGQYLPSNYVMNSWDQDENLRSSTAVRDNWTRVADFDLPKSHMSVISAAGQQAEMQIEFSGHQLNKAQ